MMLEEALIWQKTPPSSPQSDNSTLLFQLETPRPSPAGTTTQRSELVSGERQITNIIRYELRRMIGLDNQIICLSLSDVCMSVCMSVCTHYPGH